MLVASFPFHYGHISSDFQSCELSEYSDLVSEVSV